MRVLIAPDAFADARSPLDAVAAAEAIAAGWRRRAPQDVLDLAPMSDGGPGFVPVVHAARGGELLATTVAGPGSAGGSSGASGAGGVPATVCLVDGTAYVEAAQACGLHLQPQDRRDPEHATSRGVGELVGTAVSAGARSVVVGLGGVGSNDGGAGLLAALGATAEPPGSLLGGPAALEHLEAVDLTAARDRLAGVDLVAATDVEAPLLGLIGTTNVHGGSRGLAPERALAVDAALQRLADRTDRRPAATARAGAGGGLGFALLVLGASTRPGVALVADTVDLPERARAADLVVTGEASFDFSSRSGTVPYGVAEVAASAVRPCVALAGQVLVGSREMRALGIESAYAVHDLVGEDQASRDPAGALADLAERVARSWSRGWE